MQEKDDRWRIGHLGSIDELIVEMLTRVAREGGCVSRIKCGSRAYKSLCERLNTRATVALAESRGVPFEPYVYGPAGDVPFVLDMDLPPDAIVTVA